MRYVFLKTLAAHYAALQGTVLIFMVGDPKGMHPDRSLCSSSEVIYILLHAQLLTIRQVECRWSLWKTWAINSHNKDEIPSHSKVQSMSWRMARQRGTTQHQPHLISWAGALTRKGTLNLWWKSEIHIGTRLSCLLEYIIKPVSSCPSLLSSLLLMMMR